MPGARGARWFAFAIAVVALVGFSSARGDDLLSRAMKARDSGHYAEAISTLQQLVASHPDREDYELLLAETFAWDHQYARAETSYRLLLSRDPHSRPALLGLARALLWQGRYAESSREIETLLARDPNDLDALELKATGEYWRGDFRTAARELARILRADPDRATSRRILDEIHLASRPREWVSVKHIDDDQPFRLSRAEMGASIFSDPLTRWSAIAGTFRAASSAYGTNELPFVRFENRTTFPSLRLTIEPTIGFVRYADGERHGIGGLGVTRKLGRHNAIELRAERKEILYTATGLATHPWADSIGLGWKFSDDRGWSGESRVETVRYFDHNRGTSAWAWGLAPFKRSGRLRLRAGLSGAFMNTRETRFEISAVSSIRDGDSFDYSYRGEYVPYWTPRHLREARAILVADADVGRVRFELHGDAGIARDEAIAFGPSSGLSPIPSTTYAFPFDREFHPFRARLSASVRIGRDLTFEAGVELSQTVFYRARNVDVSLVRHR